MTVRVLVVENDDATLRAIAKAVSMLGYEHRVARDGEEAWAMQIADPCDIVLCDWRMPKLSGVELCRKIRAAEDGMAYAYFILFSGYDDNRRFIDGMEAGVDDFHGTPIDLDELRARLKSAERVITLHKKLRHLASERSSETTK